MGLYGTVRQYDEARDVNTNGYKIESSEGLRRSVGWIHPTCPLSELDKVRREKEREKKGASKRRERGKINASKIGI